MIHRSQFAFKNTFYKLCLPCAEWDYSGIVRGGKLAPSNCSKFPPTSPNSALLLDRANTTILNCGRKSSEESLNKDETLPGTDQFSPVKKTNKKNLKKILDDSDEEDSENGKGDQANGKRESRNGSSIDEGLRSSEESKEVPKTEEPKSCSTKEIPKRKTGMFFVVHGNFYWGTADLNAKRSDSKVGNFLQKNPGQFCKSRILINL